MAAGTSSPITNLIRLRMEKAGGNHWSLLGDKCTTVFRSEIGFHLSRNERTVDHFLSTSGRGILRRKIRKKSQKSLRFKETAFGMQFVHIKACQFIEIEF